jgi:hypothetical protein
METKYDATYHFGKTTVHIVSPETVLGRKMTEEEKQKVLDEIIKVNVEIYKSRIAKGEIA